MSAELKQIFEQVYKLSWTEQLLLIATIAQILREEESERQPEDEILPSVPPIQAVITKGDKSTAPESLFGIWEKKPRNLQEIRQKAWERN